MKANNHNSDQNVIEKALLEDIGRGDITTDAIVEQSQQSRAQIIAQESGVLAGLAVIEKVFRSIDGLLRLKTSFNDGDNFQTNDVIFQINGRLASILKAERVALNFLGHLSGVATLTADFVEKIKGTRAKITDTRKTIPLLRAMEKEAVLAGGGVNHRMGLYDTIVIKENHIRAAGSIKKAVEQTRRFLTQTAIKAKIEVEATNVEQVRDAIENKVDRVLLINMKPIKIKAAVRMVPEEIEVEASGHIDAQNVRDIAKAGVDFISIGELTNAAPSINFSLVIKTD